MKWLWFHFILFLSYKSQQEEGSEETNITLKTQYGLWICSAVMIQMFEKKDSFSILKFYKSTIKDVLNI